MSVTARLWRARRAPASAGGAKKATAPQTGWPLPAALLVLLVCAATFAIRHGGTDVASFPPTFPPPLSRPRRDDGYSSFECIGRGSQFPLDFRVDGFFDTPGNAAHTICKLRDVCFVEQQLTYFESHAEASAPPYTRFSAFPDGGPACIGLIAGVHVGCNKTPSVAVHHGPRPRTLPFASPHGVVHFLDRMSDASNWGHLMSDTLIPTYGAAALFGDNPTRAQLLLGNDCVSFTDNPGLAHLPADVRLKDGRLPREACADNLARWVPFLFSLPPLLPPHADGCFHELVLGHSHAFSLGHWYAHRGAAYREARLNAHTNMALPLPEATPPTAHSVLVWLKVEGQTTPLLNASWDICADVKAWVRALPGPRGEEVAVSCVAPAALSPREQLACLAKATVIVTEHGSTTYLAPFARPGTSVLIIGIKEAHVLLGLPDVRVLYVALDAVRVGGEGPGLLGLALDFSGRRMGLPAVG